MGVGNIIGSTLSADVFSRCVQYFITSAIYLTPSSDIAVSVRPDVVGCH